MFLKINAFINFISLLKVKFKNIYYKYIYYIYYIINKFIVGSCFDINDTYSIFHPRCDRCAGQTNVAADKMKVLLKSYNSLIFSYRSSIGRQKMIKS